MQHVITIETKFLSPTDAKGSRIKAVCNRFKQSKSFPYAHELDVFENHLWAAKALSYTNSVYGCLVSFSETKDGYSFHFVFMNGS